MSLLPTGLSALTLLAATACTPTHTSAPSNPPTASVATPASSAPTGAMAKRAPPRPGEQVSPVIAFRGTGTGWNLQIENAGGYAHDADLTWDDGNQQATGSLEYQPTPGASAGAPIVLVGTLATPAGPRSVRVEIKADACKAAAGEAYTHAVHATIEGMALMHGCGDLAK